MCSDPTYEEKPALTIGGPSGDYFVTCPTTSCKWAEYAIDSVVNGDGGTGAVVVSGNSKPSALDYTGLAQNTFSDDALIKGVPIRVPATVTQVINSSWERITNSQKRVFVRIDAAASTSMFVTIRFRIKVLDIIPGPTQTGHADAMQEMNEARAEMTMKRLQTMGIPGYAQNDSKSMPAKE